MVEASTPKIRWWPFFVILALAVLYLGWTWLGPAASQQERVLSTLPALFGTAFLLLLWLLLFSGLPGRLRLQLGALVTSFFLLAGGLFAAGFLEIVGVSGNLVPIFKWKSGTRDYGETVHPADAGVTAPGPHDYPQFLGPERSAKITGTRLARDWRANPPREVWRHDVGEAWSSFAIVGDAAVTQELRGSEEMVVRYELQTGRTVWRHAYEAAYNSTIGGNGPRGTPTIADGRVYALGATGVLSAVDLADGRLLWSKNVVEENEAQMPEWGIASSPLVAGDLILLQPGLDRDTGLVAYDRATGDLVWRAKESAGSYSSPFLTSLGGVAQIVMVYKDSVSGHDPESGRILWDVSWPGSHPKVSMPLPIADDTLLISAGYGLGSRLLKLAPAEDGSFTVDEIWESRRLKSKFANLIYHEGTVYGLDDGVLVAIDPATGERRWKRGRYGHGQMILVDDLLLIQTEKGAVVLVEASPEEHRELATLPALSSKTWNPPALSGRFLLLRNNFEAVCYELPVEGTSS